MATTQPTRLRMGQAKSKGMPPKGMAKGEKHMMSGMPMKGMMPDMSPTAMPPKNMAKGRGKKGK